MPEIIITFFIFLNFWKKFKKSISSCFELNAVAPKFKKISLVFFVYTDDIVLLSEVEPKPNTDDPPKIKETSSWS